MVVAAVTMVYAGLLERARLASLASALDNPCPAAVCSSSSPDAASSGRSLLFAAAGGLGGGFGGLGVGGRALMQAAQAAGQSPLGAAAEGLLGSNGTAAYGEGGLLGPRSCYCANDPAPMSIFMQVRVGTTRAWRGRRWRRGGWLESLAL